MLNAGKSHEWMEQEEWVLKTNQMGSAFYFFSFLLVDARDRTEPGGGRRQREFQIFMGVIRLEGLKQAGETCEGRWREGKDMCLDGGLHNFWDRGNVSGTGVEANKTPSSGGQVCIYFFHAWVKLLPLGHQLITWRARRETELSKLSFHIWSRQTRLLLPQTPSSFTETIFANHESFELFYRKFSISSYYLCDFKAWGCVSTKKHYKLLSALSFIEKF